MRPNSRLNPAHLHSPRMRSLLRLATVAGLLALAAGTVLLDPPRQGDCRTAPDPPTLATPETSGGPAGVQDGVPDDVARLPAPPGGGAVPDRPDPHTAKPLPPGTVGVPVQLAEPGTAAVLRPGDRVDVIARTGSLRVPLTADEDDPVLAPGALVLSVTSPDDGVVYLAMTPRQAEQVSRIAPGVALGITVRPN
ncbi:MAG TPA: hypothetical protein VFZ32_01510 [Micromonosporaceae bacterium]